jgi:hypothetical protein
MAQIGDFVWSEGMIASIDRVRESPTALYKFEGRAIGYYTGTNYIKTWPYFDYLDKFYSSENDPLVVLADLEQIADFLKLSKYKAIADLAKPFLTELVLWILARET